jgi:sensor domain CHASE-containing protein
MRVSRFLILLLSVLIASAASRTLLDGISQASEADQEEHQRILAELEEVHHLRERMLQQGMCVLYPCLWLVSSTSRCLSAPVQ